MTVEEGIAIGVGVMGLVSSIVTPAIIVGRYLGNILATQVQHAEDHKRHYQSAKDQGVRFERLGEALAELRGELRGRSAPGDFSSGHRIP